MGLLLPAVQAAPETAARTGEDPKSATQTFVFGADKQEVGLLLPAVQAAREAARVETPDMDDMVELIQDDMAGPLDSLMIVDIA